MLQAKALGGEGGLFAEARTRFLLEPIANPTRTPFSDGAVIPFEGEDHVIALVNVEGVGKRRGEAFKSDLLEVFRFEGEKIIEIRPSMSL